MPERNGYKPLGLVAIELGVSEDKVRALIALLKPAHRGVLYDHQSQSSKHPESRELCA
jgi:hypothetical protein